MRLHYVLLALAVMSGTAHAQESAPVPGKGLRQHPFLYCGEWQDRGKSEQVMKLVRDGNVVCHPRSCSTSRARRKTATCSGERRRRLAQF